MTTSTATRPAVNARPITPADPRVEKPAYDVPVAALVFGARIRHKVIPGVWKVVREASRLDSTSRYHVRVREIAENGSLFGPVLSWRIDEVAELVTVEPTPAPAEAPAPVAAEPRLVDDDGTPLETPGEMDVRHRSEHMARVRELMEGNRFLPGNTDQPAPCCPDDEPMLCAACLAHEGPADLSDDGWEDEFRWELTPDDELPARSLAEEVDGHARELRAIGSPLHDLLAERAESLAAQIRALDATTVAQYRDRRDAMLDGAVREAKARLLAAGCL